MEFDIAGKTRSNLPQIHDANSTSPAGGGASHSPPKHCTQTHEDNKVPANYHKRKHRYHKLRQGN